MSLIAIEGIDGTGKSTLWERLKQKLPAKDIVFTREPTRNSIGQLARDSTSNAIDPMAQLFLFMADHADHLNKVIRPVTGMGLDIITDRYILSRIAYQANTLNIANPADFIWSLHKGWTVIPDKTILLTMNPREAVKRIGNRQIKGWEQIEFLSRVQKTYLDIVCTYKLPAAIISAEMEPDDVFEFAYESIMSVMQNKR